ncbi:MAG: type II toxin-antitoxin system RelE family toxin [Bryobacteraceae bacterium]
MTLPDALKIEWSEEARAGVRRLGRVAAMQVFEGMLRYARTGSGDVKPLRGDLAGSFRLRIGDYRVMFELQGDTMRIFGVRHRREAYR